MTCEEFQEVAAAYALGALDPDERVAAEAHLAERAHRGCEEALRRAYETVVVMASSLPPVAPGEGVWRAIEARIGGDAAPASAEPRRERARWAGPLAAAAAVLFVALWLGERRSARHIREQLAIAQQQVVVAQQQVQAQGEARAQLERDLAAARTSAETQRQVLALLDTPGSRIVTLDPAAGHTGRAAAVLNVATKQAVIVAATLPPQPGKTYQLWVIRGKAAPSPAGFLQPSGGLLVGQVDPTLLASAPDALAVSLEPPGGSPAPTDVTLVGKVAG